MYNKREVEDDNCQVGIEIPEFENSSYGDGKEDYKETRARTVSHGRASEFSPKQEIKTPQSVATKFGDAILTKAEDIEAIDARYEINLL